MRIDVKSESALETRERLQAEARSIGITEEYVSLLIDTFYAKVRAHAELGKVFDDVIQDRWPEHLHKMKMFWNSIALRTGTYKGNPLAVHVVLDEAKPAHFMVWLELFKATLVETAPNHLVVDYFMGYANTMALRLSKAMFP